ncbi:hypothetical protein U9M73_02790 [Paenibacillus phoenicis]|uniref:Uncharacterized protein n=1 Tax=Paenibacillus phoenicis TaxID=554117 RepID=A0ABU5PGN3_9BACL|nr:MULTISPECIES: hypothetical protein [Paenibacillus]MCT2194096.1 hypothetical protein [Paenibacillus sp. p3-SID1389]MEA3568924.1 hypothetical protein [Paenibacillus phoenicis]
MNMVMHELKSLRKSAFVWTLEMIALAALYLSIYPSLASDAEDFKKLLWQLSGIRSSDVRH